MSVSEITPYRDQAAFAKALRLAQADFLEMPGLHITKAQAERLWSVDPEMCAEVLDALVRRRFLARTESAHYVRA